MADPLAPITHPGAVTALREALRLVISAMRVAAPDYPPELGNLLDRAEVALGRDPAPRPSRRPNLVTGEPMTRALLAELRELFDVTPGPVPRQLARRLFDALEARSAHARADGLEEAAAIVETTTAGRGPTGPATVRRKVPALSAMAAAEAIRQRAKHVRSGNAPPLGAEVRRPKDA